mgnify:CR=1 FL=1
MPNYQREDDFRVLCEQCQIIWIISRWQRKKVCDGCEDYNRKMNKALIESLHDNTRTRSNPQKL